jgi:hypothetical protein
MSLPPSNILTSPNAAVIPEPMKVLSKGNKNALSRFMNTVSKKRPVKDLLFRFQTASSDNLTERSDHSEDERAVRFAEDPSAHYTLSRDDYASEEMRAVWLQSEEFRKINGDCLKQIRKLEQGKTLKDKKYCARGLESHTRLAAISKANNRRPAVKAVLDAQAEQQERGVYDDEDIARCYGKTASSCQMWATTVGFSDQRAAEADRSFSSLH